MHDDLRQSANNFVIATREELVRLRATYEAISARQERIESHLIEVSRKLEALASRRQLDERDLDIIYQVYNSWNDIVQATSFYKQFVNSSFDRNPIIDKVLKLNDLYDQVKDCVLLKEELERSNFREVNVVIKERVPMGWWGFIIGLFCLVILTKQTFDFLYKIFFG